MYEMEENTLTYFESFPGSFGSGVPRMMAGGVSDGSDAGSFP